MISLVAALVGIATPSDAATVTRVSPIFECYVDEGDGTYTAYFGYENRSTDVDGAPLVVTQAAGTPQNKLTPAEHEDLLPAEFGFPDVVPGRRSMRPRRTRSS